MADLIITPINETYIKVICREQYMEMELGDAFSFTVPNAKFDPRVKSGKWDGIKKLYNRQYKRIYKGLLYKVLQFAKEKNYSVALNSGVNTIQQIDIADIESAVKDFIRPHSGGKEITPYEYQIKGVHHMLSASRSICLAATSSGKSLILYLAARLYQTSDDMLGKHIFIVVPSKSLVEQLYSDFVDYSTFAGTNWNAATHCQKVSGDYDKWLNKQIIITTWQSLKNIPKTAIIDAGALFIDEVQSVNGPVLTSLVESAVNCPVRHGLTGTLDGFECNELAAEGLMGPKVRLVTAKENIDAGRATPVQVVCTVLDYDDETKKRLAVKRYELLKNKQNAYHAEIEFINELKSRINFIMKFVQSLQGNTIILFDRVDSYGIPLYNMALEQDPENTFLIVGDVEAKEREEIRKLLETRTGVTVWATDKIMSTGISIKNIHNVVSVSSSKSQVKNLQTLGRLMRLHSSKKMAYIYDLVDRLDWKGVANYTMNHLPDRLKQYTSEGHPVKFITMQLDESKPESFSVKSASKS